MEVAMATKKADASTKTEDSLLIAKVAEWPGAFGAFKYSSRAIINNLGAVFALIGISILVNIIGNAFNGNTSLMLIYSLALTIASFIIGIATYIVYLTGAKGDKIEVGEALKQSLSVSLLVNMFVLSIMVGLSVIVGLLLFIIPGLIILPRLMLAPCFLIDQKLDCVEAYKASWNTTKGHSGKIWGTIGATVVMILPIFTLIGIPLTIYLLFMYAAIGAILYVYINKTGAIKQ